MTEIQAVLFDWGNTLVEYPMAEPAAQVTFLDGFLRGVGDLLPDLARALDSSDAAADLWRFNSELDTHRVRPLRGRLEELLGCQIDVALADEIEQRLCSVIFEAEEPIAGTRSALQSVSNRGLAWGIVSNTPWGTSPRLWRRRIISHPSMSGTSPAVSLCGDVGYRKPHPSCIRACCEALGVDPRRAVLVGDNLASDGGAAKAAGSRFIWYSTEAVACAIPTIDDLARLEAILDQM